MAVFGWTRDRKPAPEPEADFGLAGLTDPAALLEAVNKAVPRYLALADDGKLTHPACKRKPADAGGDLRTIWEHTRLEAVRYVAMVPRQEPALLVDPARQAEMIDAFLRQRPHDNTVIDFTGTAIEDYGIAIYAALNWLNHCGALAGADPRKFSGTLRSFRKVMVVAQQWWALEGATERCAQMLQAGERPPLTLFLLWSECTNLGREIALASAPGSSDDAARSAQEPDELPGR